MKPNVRTEAVAVAQEIERAGREYSAQIAASVLCDELERIEDVISTRSRAALVGVAGMLALMAADEVDRAGRLQ